MIIFITILAWSLSAVVFLTTVLPLTHSLRWWVRAWEFPRVHITALALVCIVLVLMVGMAAAPMLILGLLACILYQCVQIFPYTRLAKTEVDILTDTDPADRIRVLSANVLMENTRKADLVKIIEREDPDVFFLMETDTEWLTAMEPILKRYTTVLTYPLDNYYGLIFATRLTAPKAEVIFLSDDNTPAVQAELLSRDGVGFNFIGLHPRPPVPGNDTKTRDKQIKKAAQITGHANWPTLCMGDFNDVAWSWTSRRFKKYGEFLEPRVGRGMFSTFHAQYPLLAVPIDQLYITEGIGLVSFGRLEEFGSDHYPVAATITVPKR